MLTRADIEFFVINGYVLKRAALPRALTDAATDVVWENMPPPYRRDDPSSWGAAIADCRGTMTTGDRFGLVKLRKEIITDPRVAAITTQNGTIRTMAGQLLGEHRMAPPRRFRGLYPIFPTPEHAGLPVNGHIDETPEMFRLGVGVYLNRIEPGGGGLLVWPKSHRSLHFAARTTGCTYDDLATGAFLAAYHAWNRSAPVMLTVEAGDVVFFHNRLLHCPSINIRPDHVRLAAYFNIRATGDMPSPVGGLWDGWDGVRQTGSDVVARTDRTPASAPKTSGWDPARRALPKGGAHGSFARELARVQARAPVLQPTAATAG